MTGLTEEKDKTASEEHNRDHYDSLQVEVAQSYSGRDDVMDDVSNKPEVPDGGWGWFCVLGCLISHLIIGGIERSGGVIYLELQSKFEGSSASATSWIFSLNTALRQCLGPVVGALCGRLSCRTVVMAGGVISCVGLVLSSFPPVLGYLHFSFGVLTGIGFALAYAPSVIIVGQYFDKYRGKAVGVGVSGVGVGSFAVAPLTEVLLSLYGYSGAMLVLAGISLNLSVGGALFRPLETHRKLLSRRRSRNRRSLDEGNPVSKKDEFERPMLSPNETNKDDTAKKSDFLNEYKEQPWNSLEEQAHKRTAERASSVDITDSSQSTCLHTFVKKYLDITLLKDIPFLSFCIAIFLFSIAFQASLVFLPALARDRGVSKERAAYIMGIIGVSDTTGRILAGVIFDRPRILAVRRYLYNLDVLFIAAVTFFCTFVTSFTGFAVIGACYGLVTGMYISQKSVVIVDLVGPEVLNSSFGLLIWFQGVGSLIGPPISGVFRDKFSRYDEAFYFGGSITILASSIMFAGNIISSRYRRTLKTRTTTHT